MSTESNDLPVVRIVTDEAYELATSEEARRDLADMMRMGRKNGLHLGDERPSRLEPCGCLRNAAGAHRVGCPDHPEGVRG